MMTEVEAGQLLQICAAYDQRTVGRTDITAWWHTAVAGNWDLDYARRAVIEHYAEQTDRVMPAHITRIIRSRSSHYASTYQHQPIPGHIRGAEAETAWERQQIADHIQACMDRWARGEDQ
jgi:hypothetical protein